MKKKATLSLMVFLLGAAVATSIAFKASKEAYRNKRIQQEIDTLKQEAQRINSENGELENRIAYFSTAGFQERVAKEKLNLQKPEEQVIVMKPLPENTQQEVKGQETFDDQLIVEIPNYKKWWDFFFKY